MSIYYKGYMESIYRMNIKNICVNADVKKAVKFKFKGSDILTSV